LAWGCFPDQICDDYGKSSNAGDLEDVSDHVVPLLEILKRILGHSWLERRLEGEVEEDKEYRWLKEQHDIDRDMVLSTMFAPVTCKTQLICSDPDVREELMQTPFGKQTLDYMTITQDQLLGIKPESMRIEPCSDDPDMLELSFQPNNNVNGEL
jgi:hypothetical protein